MGTKAWDSRSDLLGFTELRILSAGTFTGLYIPYCLNTDSTL